MPSHKRDKNGRPSDERRCTFSYPGGRRCNEFRAKGHDSLCLYHYRREQKLDPSTSPEAREIVSKILGTREQFKTATEVNDALAKVFALRGRKLISVRDATLFAYLSQLLLISLNSVEHEFTQVYEHSEWEKLIERILQLPGATLPPLENVAPPFKAAGSSSPSNGGNSSGERAVGGNSAAVSSDDVIPRSGATRNRLALREAENPSSRTSVSHPSSSTEASSRPPRLKRNKKSGLLPATRREFAQHVFSQVAIDRAERRERTAARVAQLERQLNPGESEQSEPQESEETHALTSP
jgi:hypothetical protein